MIVNGENCSRDVLITVGTAAPASGYTANQGQIPTWYPLSQVSHTQHATKVIMNILHSNLRKQEIRMGVKPFTVVISPLNLFSTP